MKQGKPREQEKQKAETPRHTETREQQLKHGDTQRYQKHKTNSHYPGWLFLLMTPASHGEPENKPTTV
jgi:hypothetical protein